MKKNGIKHVFLFCFLSISLYYSAFSQEKSFLKTKLKLDAIDFSNPLLIPIYSCEIDEIEQNMPHFKTVLPQNEWDNFYAVFLKKKTIVENQYAFIDDFLYIKAQYLLIDKDTAEALKILTKALQYNRFNTYAIIAKSELLRKISGLNTAAPFLHHSLTELTTRSDLNALGELYYNIYSDSISNYIKNELYNDALAYFNNRLDFTNNIKINNINQKEELATLKNIHTGIYTSINEVANTAFNEKKKKLAETFALRAWDYYAENSNYIENKNPTDSLIFKILEDYNKQAGYSDAEERNYYLFKIDQIQQKTDLQWKPPLAFAEANIDIAEDISKDVYKQENINNTTTTKIPTSPAAYAKIKKKYDYSKQKECSKLIEESRILLAENQPYRALTLIEHAQNICVYYVIKDENIVRTLHTEIVVSYINQIINKAQYNVWINNLQRADSLFANAQAIQLKYSLIDNLDIQNGFDVYQAYVSKKRCEMQQEYLNNIVLQTKNMITQKLYQNAYTTISTALSTQDTSGCKLDFSNVIRQKQLLEPVIIFFNLTDKAKSALNRKDTFTYITISFDAYTYYEQHKAVLFGLPNPDLYYKCVFNKDIAILQASMEYFYASGNYAECKKYIMGLESLGIKNKRMKTLIKNMQSNEK